MNGEGDSRGGGEDAAAGLLILLALEDERWEAAGGFGPSPEAFVRRAVEAALSGAGIAPDVSTELSVTLADDAAVRAVNRRWRGKDRPTNVLSFPMRDLAPGEPPGPMLGDLILAFETVRREAADEGKSLADHLCHLLVHGTLHCLGFDHESDREAERMEALEAAILARLGMADPYREPPAPAAGGPAAAPPLS